MTPYNQPRWQGGDDQRLPLERLDLSGGQNTRQQANIIKETQAVELTNMDITIPGQRQKRPGSIKIGDDIGNDDIVLLREFPIQGATDQLLAYHGTKVEKWSGTGNWVELKTDFTVAQTDVSIIAGKESGLIPDDVVIVQNGTDNAFRIDTDGNEQDLGDTNTSPPLTTVGAWFRNRFWYLKNDLAYYSDAYDDDYSGAFDRTLNAFRIPVGVERAIVPTRDLGLVFMGVNSIWALNPSSTPAATDKPEVLTEFVGCVSKKGWETVGDDIYFFAQDGLRELRRTVQDKVQTGDSYPISFPLKEQFDAISWGNIGNLTMKYFNNKLFIAVPTGATTYDTWVYYPSYNAFTVMKGVHPTAMETYSVSGEENFYYAGQGNGQVFQGWIGTTDEGATTTTGTAISMIEQGREEDFGQKFIKKVGGEFEVSASAVNGSISLTVSAKVDGGGWIELNTMDLQSDTLPVLPVLLPFDLADDLRVRKKFHLDSLGAYRVIQFKIENAQKNTEEIKIFGTRIVAFPEEYQSE